VKIYGRGRLTDADRARIEQLAAAGQKANSIAREIERHPSTVMWFMYTQGLAAPRRHPNRDEYIRRGRVVRPFTPAEDRFIESKRVAGVPIRRIAELANEQFNRERTQHAVHVRLVMLAAREDAA
jgi:hypothetical protein